MRNLYPTTAQIAAARRNGVYGRSPLSPQTRAKSALNARKHGLCSKILLAEGEAPDRLHDRDDDLFEEFQPRTTSDYLIFEGNQLRACGFEQGAIKKRAANSREAWRPPWRRAFEPAPHELLPAAVFCTAPVRIEPNTPQTREEENPQ